MQQQDQVNKILVVGANQVGKKHLIHQLFSKQHNQSNANADNTSSAAVSFSAAARENQQDQQESIGTLSTCSQLLRLQNKYYTANVQFTCYKPHGSVSAKDLAASTILKELPSLDQFHAIIILFSLYNVC